MISAQTNKPTTAKTGLEPFTESLDTIQDSITRLEQSRAELLKEQSEIQETIAHNFGLDFLKARERFHEIRVLLQTLEIEIAQRQLDLAEAKLTDAAPNQAPLVEQRTRAQRDLDNAQIAFDTAQNAENRAHNAAYSLETNVKTARQRLETLKATARAELSKDLLSRR